MVSKLFWLDPYQTELETRVTKVAGPEVCVAETIFFAFSGGQESDHGTFNGGPVLNARNDGLQIYYELGPGHGLVVGDPVQMVIDKDRRGKLMRLHFAAELVLELVCQKFPAVAKVGAHIAEDKARIDFEWNGSIAPELPDLQTTARAIVDDNKTIECDFSDVAAERRYWAIDGFSKVPCGGTHVKHTGEIGLISLKRKNPGKGKERIEIFVG